MSSDTDMPHSGFALHFALLIAAVLGGVGGLAALIFYNQGERKQKDQITKADTQEKSPTKAAVEEQTTEQAEFLLLVNQSDSLNDEILFWFLKDVLVPKQLSMELELKTLSELCDERERALNKKYGYTRVGLASLNKPMGEAFGVLRDATKDVRKRYLELAYRSALNDLSHPVNSKSEVYHNWAQHAHTQIVEEIKRLEQVFWKAR